MNHTPMLVSFTRSAMDDDMWMPSHGVEVIGLWRLDSGNWQLGVFDPNGNPHFFELRPDSIVESEGRDLQGLEPKLQ